MPPSKRTGRGAAPTEAAPPWVIRPVSARAKKQWDEALADEPQIMGRVRTRLRDRPLDRSDNPRRTHPLQGSLATKNIGGKRLPQYQHEMTSAGRIWYCADKTARIVWITFVEVGRPVEVAVTALRGAPAVDPERFRTDVDAILDQDATPRG